VLVLISPDSISSRQIEDEVKWARELRKSFVPVVHGMSWGQFQERKVRWRMALGIAAGVALPKEGVSAILPRMLRGLENLGVRSAPATPTKSTKEASPKPRPQPQTKALKPAPVREPKASPPKPSFAVRRVSPAPSDAEHRPAASSEARGVVQKKQVSERIRPNDICPCGSGKKYRKCHGALSTPAIQRNRETEQSSEKHSRVTLREVGTLSGHSGVVMAVAVTPDGQRAVSASRDETLKLWDLAGGHELRTLSGHSGPVTAVAVTPDGQRAVSASRNTTLQVWGLSSGRNPTPRILSGHTDWVYAVAVTPDGRRAVSASRDQTLNVWDLASGQKLRTLSGHTNWVRAVAVTPDGQRAVSASRDQTLKVWDLNSGELLASLECKAEALCCAYYDDGRQIIAGDFGGGIYLLRVEEDSSA
jgi:hypothetical protein